MDTKSIHEQIALGKKAIDQVKNQNRIFESLIQNELKNAPECDKKEIQVVQTLTSKVIRLAKEGKTIEAENLIKEFNNERQSKK